MLISSYHFFFMNLIAMHESWPTFAHESAPVSSTVGKVTPLLFNTFSLTYLDTLRCL